MLQTLLRPAGRPLLPYLLLVVLLASSPQLFAQAYSFILELNAVDKKTGTPVSVDSYQVFHQSPEGKRTTLLSGNPNGPQVKLQLNIIRSGNYLILLQAPDYYLRQIRVEPTDQLKAGGTETMQVALQPKAKVQDLAEEEIAVRAYDKFDRAEDLSAPPKPTKITYEDPPPPPAVPATQEREEEPVPVYQPKKEEPAPAPIERTVAVEVMEKPQVAPTPEPPAPSVIPKPASLRKKEEKQEADIVTINNSAKKKRVKSINAPSSPLEEPPREQSEQRYRLRFDTALKSSSSVNSQTVLRLRAGTKVTLLYKTVHDYWRVRTENDRVGYLRPRDLEPLNR